MNSRQPFSKLAQPFIVCVIREQTPEEAIATIKNGEYDGAQAFNLHLTRLAAAHHNLQDLRAIIHGTVHPVCAVNYRYTVGMADNERVSGLLMAVEAGAAAVDIPADTYDPHPTHYSEVSKGTDEAQYRNAVPKELSMQPEVIAKQKELIAQVHDMGAEVMLSSHTRVVMSAEQVVAHAQEMESRGADMVKIVSMCLNQHDLIEAFRAIVELKKVMKVPFQYQCHGEQGKLTRVVGPMLGSMLVFCNQQYTVASFHEQPLVHAMRSVFQNVNWKVSPPSAAEHFHRSS